MNKETYGKKYGPWAIVCGCAEGIGSGFALRLAEWGFNLCLVDKKRKELAAFAAQIRDRFGAETDEIHLDLGHDGLVAAIDRATNKRDIGLLVYNAAEGPVRPFMKTPLEDLSYQVSVNAAGPALLSRYFAQRFMARGSGGIIIMSSIAGFQGESLVATYAATKAYDTTLGEALYHELGPLGIDVLVCAAGTTKTPGYLSTDPRYGLLRPKEADLQFVADQALTYLGRKQVRIISASNRFILFVMHRLLGRRIASGFFDANMRRAYRHRM